MSGGLLLCINIKEAHSLPQLNTKIFIFNTWSLKQKPKLHKMYGYLKKTTDVRLLFFYYNNSNIRYFEGVLVNFKRK